MEDRAIYQRWLRRQITQKCLEILLLLYLMDKRFEKLRVTFWEILCNLWKVLGKVI